MKKGFGDFKNNFIEILNVQTELFTNHQKELFFTILNLFKNELLISPKQHHISLKRT